MKQIKLKYLTNSLLLATIFAITSCGDTAKETGLPTSSLDLTNTFVYDTNSPYKNVLKECVTSSNDNTSCSLNKLPLLRDEDAITKASIKARLVVSHKWMGDRFLEVLDYLDDDIKTMLGAVTAIVIDDDIKPAFYTTQTGAIYIDARYLWLNSSEASDITKKDDFRSSYGSDLEFIPTWRYVKNGKKAMVYWDLNNAKDRTINDIKLNLARLLYHELSHANDFAGRSVTDGADKSLPIINILESRKEYRVSNRLYQDMSLTSNTLSHLGRILYFGESATSSDKTLSSSDVGAIFQGDNASNMYAYANQYEDLAMLFETAMMKYHYNIEMDIAFTNNPTIASSCNDYVVGWGVRNRIADSSVAKRVNFVLKNILPNGTNWDNFTQNGLGAKSTLPTVGWCSSIDNSTKAERLNNTQNSTPVPYEDFTAPDYK